MKVIISILTLLFMLDGKSVEEKIEEVKNELGTEFKIEVLEKLFIVASNDDATNYKYAKNTVSHVFNAMYKDFMEKKPTEPIKVYLFKDKESYEKYHTEKLGRKPHTPFGFYSSEKRTMVMNIATGTGTLAHEMVHPLIGTDFPDVPSWFNEGFASLYEQSTYLDDGSMKGLVNWRLPALQKAIKNNEDISLKTIMETSSNDFYEAKHGYAVARYLCLYLQEKGMLKDFYKKYKKGYKDDKSGVKSLEAVVNTSLDEIEKDWKGWVAKLKYKD